MNEKTISNSFPDLQSMKCPLFTDTEPADLPWWKSLWRNLKNEKELFSCFLSSHCKGYWRQCGSNQSDYPALSGIYDKTLPASDERWIRKSKHGCWWGFAWTNGNKTDYKDFVIWNQVTHALFSWKRDDVSTLPDWRGLLFCQSIYPFICFCRRISPYVLWKLNKAVRYVAIRNELMDWYAMTCQKWQWAIDTGTP